jgi:hypothetical protein
MGIIAHPNLMVHCCTKNQIEFNHYQQSYRLQKLTTIRLCLTITKNQLPLPKFRLCLTITKNQLKHQPLTTISPNTNHYQKGKWSSSMQLVNSILQRSYPCAAKCVFQHTAGTMLDSVPYQQSDHPAPTNIVATRHSRTQKVTWSSAMQLFQKL